MLKAAKISFWLLIFSLPFMKHNIRIGGLGATSTDLFFLLTSAFLAIAVLRRQVRLRWHTAYALLLAYFAAMLLSAVAAADLERTALKLATQAYLLCIPVLALALVESRDDLRTAFQVWLAATAVTAGLGAVSVLLFALGVDRSFLEYPLHHYGTLPPGNYPRIESTFDFPAMLCNYLTVSLAMLFIAQRLGWVGVQGFYMLLAAIGATALFTLTPGLGGIVLLIALAAYVSWRPRRQRIALGALSAGIVIGLLFVLAATVTPILHPTAPFLIQLPGLESPVAPAVRLLAWIEAVAQFSRQPIIGTGIGSNAVAVEYFDPSGAFHLIGDAHNVFLNFAVQCGVIGLAAMILLVAYVARLTGPLRLTGANVVRLGLGVAWLNAFAYQGLTGSYEDARHLWVAFGLLLVSVRLESRVEKPPEAGAIGRPVLSPRV